MEKLDLRRFVALDSKRSGKSSKNESDLSMVLRSPKPKSPIQKSQISLKDIILRLPHKNKSNNESTELYRLINNMAVAKGSKGIN